MGVIDLEPNQELKFQVGEDPVKLELRAGVAEVYGTEMFTNKTYTFPRQSRAAVFTYQGAKIEMTGTPVKSHVGKKSDHMICYLKVHGELEKMREEAEAISEHMNFNTKPNESDLVDNNDNQEPSAAKNASPDLSRTPICLICKPDDPRNVDKSTLCRILLNYAARRGRAPIFVDLDPDQGHIGIPGTIGALSIESPIDIETGLQLRSSLLMHFGHTSPSADSENKSRLVYKGLVENMAKIVHSKLEKDKKSFSSGVIINSCSWTDDADYQFLVHICKTFKVNMVLVMDDEMLQDDLKKDLSECQPPVTVHSVPKTGGIITRAIETSVELRWARIKEYFYGTPTESYNPMTSEVKFAFLKRLIYRIGQPIMLPDSLMPLGTKARDQNVKVSHYECTASDLLHHILAISYCRVDDLDQDPEAALRANIMGFICVTSVKSDGDIVCILTPQKLPSPMNHVLLYSDVQYMDSLL